MTTRRAGEHRPPARRAAGLSSMRGWWDEERADVCDPSFNDAVTAAHSIRAMPRTDRATRVIAAPPDRVFDAMVDGDALLAWLPPRGMTATFERFDPRPGGSYRLVLSYGDPANARPKSTADSDIVEARYVDIVDNVRVIQAVDFVSDDPQFAGTMTMTWAVSAVEGGARVDITADDVPDGISADDHARGLTSSLDNLATYIES